MGYHGDTEVYATTGADNQLLAPLAPRFPGSTVWVPDPKQGDVCLFDSKL